MAYAALASVIHITERVLDPDHEYLINIPCQKELINSIHQTACFFIDFLEDCSHNPSQTLNNLIAKIRDASYKIEDILESHLSNHFQKRPESEGNKESEEKMEILSQQLEEVLEEVNSLVDEVKNIKDEDRQQMNSTDPYSSQTLDPRRRITKTMVGVEDDLLQLKDRLTGRHSNLQVIPIVGMGGIGKTTLARSLYDDQLIFEHFHLRGWSTISEQYSVHEILISLLSSIGEDPTGDLEECLYKKLRGRKYMIVLDDMWDTKAWDEMRRVFPNDYNGSRIMITTRLFDVGGYVTDSVSHPHQMRLLDDQESWDLLRREVFADEPCPGVLEDVGKRISRNCQGLPLAIAVIGGLLSKAGDGTTELEYWEYVAENMHSVVAGDNEINCLELLALSYKHLPHHLKACFLYLAIFPEDYEISATKLLRMWVADGILRPVSCKNMEEVAELCLDQLIDRNLVLIHKRRSKGKPKTCRVHDLLRDVCLREARNEKFLYVLNKNIRFRREEASNQRRLSIHLNYERPTSRSGDPNEEALEDRVLTSMPLTRSFIRLLDEDIWWDLKLVSKLLRIFIGHHPDFATEFFQLVNLKYISMGYLRKVPSSISLLWNLQTLTVSHLSEPDLPLEIWEMPQIRHLELYDRFHLVLPDGEIKPRQVIVLKNLQTLARCKNFICSDEVVEKLPNLKKLTIFYDEISVEDWSSYRLHNLVLLRKLESLDCFFRLCGINDQTLVQNLIFPSSLKQLKLERCKLPWEYMTIVGQLPNLEVLKIVDDAFQGTTWEPNEDEFCQLRFLLIGCSDPSEWLAESAHFPCLRCLVLARCYRLREIPIGVGEIPTLETIELHNCNPEIEASARQIQDENNDIKLLVHNYTLDLIKSDISQLNTSTSIKGNKLR